MFLIVTIEILQQGKCCVGFSDMAPTSVCLPGLIRWRFFYILCRMLKTNSFSGKRSDTPDSSASAQRTVSPVQNAGPGSPNSPIVAANHHPVPHAQHHQNHRSYFPRGRCRGDGGYYGGHNHFGGHHSGPNRRTPPSIHGPPYSKILVDFMMKGKYFVPAFLVS